jgi:hypothetical protein
MIAAAIIGSLVQALAGSSAVLAAATSSRWHTQLKDTPGVGLLGAVTCPSATDCVVGGVTVNSPLILTTTDTGTTWSQHAPNTSFGSISDFGTIACPSTSECLAAGFTGGRGETDQILFTSDDWTTWAYETLPAPVTKVSGIACPTVRVCWASAYYAPTAPIVANYVFHTTNAGMTWTEVAIPAAAIDVSAISCPKVTTCLVTGDTTTEQPITIATVNTGGNWAEQMLPTGVTRPEHISCPTVTHCMVAASTTSGYAVLVTTTNGGLTWSAGVPLGVENGSVGGVYCATNDDCAAVLNPEPDARTPSPEYMITKNQGRTWISQSSVGIGLTAVACNDALACWAVGAGGKGGMIFSNVAPG